MVDKMVVASINIDGVNYNANVRRGLNGLGGYGAPQNQRGPPGAPGGVRGPGIVRGPGGSRSPSLDSGAGGPTETNNTGEPSQTNNERGPTGRDNAGEPILTNNDGGSTGTNNAGEYKDTSNAGGPTETNKAGSPTETNKAGSPTETNKAGSPSETNNAAWCPPSGPGGGDRRNVMPPVINSYGPVGVNGGYDTYTGYGDGFTGPYSGYNSLNYPLMRACGSPPQYRVIEKLGCDPCDQDPRPDVCDFCGLVIYQSGFRRRSPPTVKANMLRR